MIFIDGLVQDCSSPSIALNHWYVFDYMDVNRRHILNFKVESTWRRQVSC